MNTSSLWFWSQTWLAANLKISPRRDVWLMASMALAIVSMFVAYISRMHDVTHDAFHEMALAREWLATGSFPTDDVFAYTPTVSPAVHHEWATGLVLYWVTALSPLGLDGLIVMKFILCAILGVVLYRVARGNGAHPAVLFLLTPIVFPILWVGFATLRAQLFTLVALAIQLLLLQSDWRGRKGWVFYWIPLYLVWLNLHAGFVVGLGLLGFHFAERIAATCSRIYRQQPICHSRMIRQVTRELIREHWHLLALGPVIFGGLFLNPWGWQYVPYLVRAITMPRPTILEWKPIWFTHDPQTTLLLFGISILLLIYAAKERRWSRLRGWCFCLLAAYMALKHIRHGSLYAVLWIAMVPAWVTPTSLGKSLIEWATSMRTAWMKVACVTVVMCASFALYQPFYRATLPSEDAPSSFCYPRGVVDYLARHHIQGNVMTPFHCGAYVSWELYPAMKVSLDGRYEVAYQPTVMEHHSRFYEALDGWQEVLAIYNHDYVIVPKDTPVFARMSDSGQSQIVQWNSIYEDDAFALYSREQPRETLIRLAE